MMFFKCGLVNQIEYIALQSPQISCPCYTKYADNFQCCSIWGLDVCDTSRKCYKPIARHWVYSTANMLRDGKQSIHVQKSVYPLLIYVRIDPRTYPPSTLLEQNRMARTPLLHNRTDLLCGLDQETSWLFQIFWIMDYILLNYKEYLIS